MQICMDCSPKCGLLTLTVWPLGKMLHGASVFLTNNIK